MSKNSITITLDFDDKGKPAKISADIDNLTKAIKRNSSETEKATKTKRDFNREEKGVAGATNNTTKAFSKMSSGISSGVVKAYATLAANVFAVTAAFGALQRAAAVTQLEQGLIAVGNAGGQNLLAVAKNLQGITDNAISAAQAMEATALATSAGFSTEQLERLTKVAKGASQALGRNMADALDRLVRGTAKLEPEILDELGIMVRLDDALKDYGETLGKKATELTVFERRMAFLNTTIEQGEAKFNAIADAVDTNPYNQLSATFDNLTKNGLKLVNTFLTPFLDVLNSSQVILAGVGTLFAGSFSRQMIPSLYEASEASKQLAEDSLKLANSFINTGSNAKNLSKEYKDFVNSFKDSVVHLEDIYDAFEMLEDVKGAAYLEDAKTQESILNAVSTETKRLTQSVALLTKSRAESAKMAAYDAAQTLNIVKGYEAWKDAIRAISEQSVAQITAIEASGRSVSTYRRAILAARTGVQALSFSLKMLGVAFMAAIPYIGMAVTAFGLLKEAWGYFTKPDAITSTVDEVTKSFASFAGISKQLDNTITSLSSNTDIYLSKLKVEVGVLDQLAEGIKKVKQAEAESESFKVEAAQKKLTQAASKLTADDVALLEQGGEAAQAVVDKYERLFGRNWAEVYRQGLDQLNKAFNETTTLSTKGVNAVITVSKSFITQATASNVLGTATRNSLAQLEELTDLLDRLNRAGASTSILDGVIKQILNLRNAVNLTLGNIESLTELTAGFGKAISSEINEVSTPFSGVATNLEEVIKVFSNIKTTEEFSAALSKVDSSLAGVLQGARDSSEVITILTGLKTAWEDAGKATESAELSAASYKRISDSYKDAMKESPEAIQAYYDNLNAGIRASVTGIDKQIQALSLTEQNSGRILALERERAKVLLGIVGQNQIDAEIAALKAENAKKALEAARKLAEFELNANRELLSILSDTVTYKKEMLEAEEEMLSLRLMQEEGTSELSGIGELKLFEALKAQREELIQSEYEVKLQQVELEYDLLEFKLEVLAAEAKVAGKNDLANKILGMKSALASMEKQASDSLLKGYQAAMAKLSNTPRQLKIEIKSDISKLIEDVQAKGDSFADVFSSIFENFDGKYSDVFKQLGEFPQIFENSAKAADTFAAEQAKLVKVQETITKAKEANVRDTSELEAEYKNKSVALTKAETQSKISTWAAYGAAVGTTLNAVAETQDQTSREGFEVVKALNIAAAVVNTAAGITAALANPGGPPGVALAAVVAAMGAAQIATIASTEFGDSGAPSVGGGGGASTYSTYGGTTIGREGTQLGTSDSVEKTNELLEEIHAREYYELHSIAVGIDQLNKQLIGASENIYQDLNLDNLRSWYADPEQRIYESELRVPETTLGSLANINAPLDVQYWSYDRPKHKESQLAWNNLTAQMLADPSAKSVPSVITGILKSIAVPIIEAAKLIDPTADLQAIYDFVIEPLNISLLSEAGKELTSEELEAELMSITSVISDIAIDSIIGEQIRMYQQIDEGLLETAVRVASTRVIVADLLKDLGYVEDTSDVLITVSESFASIAGGIEEFQQISSTFSDSFYSDVQKFEKNQLNLTKIFEGIDAALTGVNVTLPDTKEGLLELLSTFNIMADESLGITEEMALANRQALVDIMQSTEQLSDYYDYLESRNEALLSLEIEKLNLTGQALAALTLEREAELAVLDPLVAAKQEEVWILQDLNTELTNATEALKSSFDYEKDLLERRFEDLEESLEGLVDEVKDKISLIEPAISSLSSAQESLLEINRKVITDSIRSIEDITAQVKIGDYSGLEDLDGNLKVLTNDNQDQYAQFEDYQRDFLRSKVVLEGLEVASSTALSVEKRTLIALEDQLSVARTTYQAQVDALDAQLNALLSIDTSVLSLVEAIANFTTAQAALNGTITNSLNNLTQTPLATATDTATPSTSLTESATISLVLDKFNQTGSVSEAISYAEGLGISYSTLQNAFSNAADSATSSDLRSDLDTVNAVSGLQGVYETARLYGLSEVEVASLYDITTDELYNILDAAGLPRFAAGGTHTGGWRLVGENGPELEYTGSSHIYNRQQANSLFNTEALENELRGLREDMRAAQYQIAKNTGEFNRILQRWDGDGLPEERVVV